MTKSKESSEQLSTHQRIYTSIGEALTGSVPGLDTLVVLQQTLEKRVNNLEAAISNATDTSDLEQRIGDIEARISRLEGVNHV